MKHPETEILLNMFPYFTHVVERITTPSWHIAKEYCRAHNLILIYDGAAVFYCNGREYMGARGDLVYFKPTDLRWAHTFPENLMKCFAVDFLYVCPVLKDGGWQLINADLPFAPVGKINDPYLFARLLDLFAAFTKHWISGKEHRLLNCRAIFMEIISLLFRWKQGGDINFDKIRKVEKVINYLTEHYTQQLSLAELGRVASLSPSYLGTIFKEVTGTSPVNYLIRVRINKAKELLKDGYRVSEVAPMVGFNDVFYFSKSFKKYEGMAPSKYKTESGLR